MVCLPIRLGSSEDSLRIRTQLRPTFACRRKTDTEEPNSVEKGTHRRKVPVPVRVCFAGASARWRFCPPGRHRSSEDSRRPRAQLRLTFACRRKTDTEESNSVEKGTHRRKTPAPVRVCFAGAVARWETSTSGEPSFVGGQHPSTRSAPANIRLQEEEEYRRVQLR